MVAKCLTFIAQNSGGVTAHVFLEAIPYEADDSPPAVTVSRLRALYERHGFRAFSGHPFSMWQKLENTLTFEGQ